MTSASATVVSDSFDERSLVELLSEGLAKIPSSRYYSRCTKAHTVQYSIGHTNASWHAHAQDTRCILAARKARIVRSGAKYYRPARCTAEEATA